MTEDRAAKIWSKIAGGAAGSRMTVSDVCAAAVPILAVSGAWVTATSLTNSSHVICVTDQICSYVAELQLTVGEGPCHDVTQSDVPVLAPDLAEPDAARRWPVFAAEAHAVGAKAVFAFPLRIGAIATSAGGLALYRGIPGPLTAVQVGDGLILADAARTLLLDTEPADADEDPARASRPGGQSPELALHRSKIDQATGIISEQLDVNVTEAFARLRAHAYAHHRALSEVARDIVTGRLRLRADPGFTCDADAGS